MSQLIFNGLVTGLLVALPALSLSLTFSVLRFANFSIGAMLTVGAYLIYWLNVAVGLALPWAAAGGALLAGVLAVVLDQMVYRPLRDRSGVTLMVASMGVSFLLENAIRFLNGNSPVSYAVDIARPWRLAGLRINHEQILIIAVCFTSLGLVWAIFRSTALGRAMRAVADNSSLAAARGISRQSVACLTWGLSGVLSALAGMLIGMDGSIEPLMGWNYVLPVFAASILGGITNPMAAVPGALIMGVLAETSTVVLPAHYRVLVAFAALSALLIVRPSGLLANKWIER